MSWPEVDFESIFAAPSRNGVYKSKEHHGSGVPIVNMGELFAFNRIGSQAMSLIQMSDAEMLKNGLIDGDLLFGRRSLVEEGAGKCSIVYKPTVPMTFESSIIRGRLDRTVADPEFFFNYFRSPVGRSRIRAIVGGAAVKGIRGSDLKLIRVHLPPIDEQIAIREVLAAYDDLIVTNQRRIALLEDAARRIHREWFVYLHFPGHESVSLKDEMPEGWSTQKLSSVANVNERTISTKDRPDSILYVDISSVSPGVIGEVSSYAFADAPGRARRRVRHGDVIWSCVRPNRRSYALIWEPDENLVASTGFAVLSASNVPFSYLYFTTTTDDFVSYLEQNATGAAYPAVTAKTFEDVDIVIPDPGLLESFDRLVLPVVEQMEALKVQNTSLVRARDLLLPKLMSGQFDVSTIPLPEEVAA
ncbi:restriction endonuclease subunit S [Phytopseudomonas daroniae]|uniref:restriction endonuclease subunit S n=1 Tax=Phytopseudomonas daroniae TaxID=2487519 RepID=UPI0010384BC7|nr:restriction endonuclease subunit S [Pseudomonas daroniae]TBU73287.1 restriction endonuclease subunit S [Pseudomonas daroniae]